MPGIPKRQLYDDIMKTRIVGGNAEKFEDRSS
jgi:hypothetical protein